MTKIEDTINENFLINWLLFWLIKVKTRIEQNKKVKIKDNIKYLKQN